MKKIISILLCVFMLHTAAFAAPQIGFNTEKAEIDISGVSEYKNSLLSLIVTKEGNEPSEFQSAALIYKLYTDENGNYQGQFLLPEDAPSGYYLVYVSGDEETGRFYYAKSEELIKCILDFENATSDTVATAIKEHKDVLGISLEGDYKKYPAWTEKALLQFIGEKKAETVTEITDYFNKSNEAAFLIAGDSEEATKALSANLLQNEISEDFSTEKIAEMLTNVRNTPKDDEKITDVIKGDLRLATAIVAVNSATRGKMTDVLKEYNDILSLDLEGDYEKLSKVEVNKALVSKNFTSLDAVQDAFKEGIKKAKRAANQSSGGTSSGGGSSSGGGMGSATFSPKPTAPVTPEKEEKVECPFTDMASVQWAEDAVARLFAKGIISGYGDNIFAPLKTVTRAEFTKMVVSLKGDIDGNKEISFDDVSENDWFAPFIKKGVMYGLVNGAGSLFMPNGEIKREDAALIIYRLLEDKIGEENMSFDDEENISDYAKEAVKKLAGAKVINGMGDGTFAPKMTLTRAQAAVLINAAMDKLQ